MSSRVVLSIVVPCFDEADGIDAFHGRLAAVMDRLRLLALRTLLFGNPVPGYTSLMVIVLILGGVQLVTLGIIGEYLGRVFNETKQRPLYWVEALRASRVSVFHQATGFNDVARPDFAQHQNLSVAATAKVKPQPSLS